MSANSGEPGPTTKGGEPTAEIPQTRESTAEIPETGEPATEQLSEDERAELERLRAEHAGSHDGGAARPSRRRFSWRAFFATILIVLGCVLAPIAVVGVWAGNQITDTGRYVATVQPLIHDPAIQNVLTDKITNEIISQLNLTGIVNQASCPAAVQGADADQLAAHHVRPADHQRGDRLRPQHRAHDHLQPGHGHRLGAGQHGRALGGGQAAVRAGQRHAHHVQRPDHAQPGPAHRRGQAGPGGARVHAGLQHPSRHRDAWRCSRPRTSGRPRPSTG